MNKKYPLVLNYLFTIALLFIMFKNIPMAHVIENIRSIDLMFICSALVTSLLFRLLYQPWLWKKVFDASKINVLYRDLFLVNAVSMPLKYVLPFKITELARPAGLRVLGNVNFPMALGASMLFKIVVLLATLSLLVSGSLLTGNMHVFILSVLGIGALLSLIVITKILPQEIFGISIYGVSHCFLNSKARSKVHIYLYALVMQAGEIITSYLIIKAFGISIPPPVLIYSISLMMVLSMVPFSIQGIGVREMVVVASLSIYVSPGIGLAVGVLITLVHHIIPALTGMLVWIFDSTSRIFGVKAVSSISVIVLLFLAIASGSVNLYAYTKKDMKGLSHKDVKTRRMAVENLRKEVKTKDVENALISALKSEQDAATRAQMLDSIVASGSAESLATVIQCLEDPSAGVRRSALMHLNGYAENPDIIIALEKLLSSPDEEEGTKLLAIDIIKQRSDAAPLLEKHIGSGNKRIRDAALRSLRDSARYGNKGSEKRWKALEKNTRDPEIRKKMKELQ